MEFTFRQELVAFKKTWKKDKVKAARLYAGKKFGFFNRREELTKD